MTRFFREIWSPVGVLMLLCALLPSTLRAEPEGIRARPSPWAVHMLSEEVENFYRVDDGVYRAAQPDRDAMKVLAHYGVSEVLNLRDTHDDKDEAKDLPLVLHRIEMETDDVSQAQLVQALDIIQNREGPILVHCWHGSDRTGVTIAAYRLVFNNWEKEQAIDEMLNGGYGFHGKMFPHLINLVESLDVMEMRAQLGIK